MMLRSVFGLCVALVACVSVIQSKSIPEPEQEQPEPWQHTLTKSLVNLGMSMMDQQQQGSDGRSKRSPHGRAFQFNTQNVFEVRGIPARFSRNKR